MHPLLCIHWLLQIRKRNVSIQMSLAVMQFHMSDRQASSFTVRLYSAWLAGSERSLSGPAWILRLKQRPRHCPAGWVHYFPTRKSAEKWSELTAHGARVQQPGVTNHYPPPTHQTVMLFRMCCDSTHIRGFLLNRLCPLTPYYRPSSIP